MFVQLFGFFLSFWNPTSPKIQSLIFPQIFRNPTSPEIQSPKFFVQDFEY